MAHQLAWQRVSGSGDHDDRHALIAVGDLRLYQPTLPGVMRARSPRREDQRQPAENPRLVAAGSTSRWVCQPLALVVVVCVLVVASSCTLGGAGEPSPSEPLEDALEQRLPPPDEEQLRELAAQYRLEDPPQDVEFERYISPEEYAAVMVPCLTEQGIPARELPDGGISFDDVRPEQARLQREAMYRCSVRFPTHPLFTEPLDEAQLGRLYDYLVEDLTECLQDEGYATPPPPSLEAFIDSYSDLEARVWSPYPVDDPRLEDQEEWARLNQTCPQLPSLKELYGHPGG